VNRNLVQWHDESVASCRVSPTLRHDGQRSVIQTLPRPRWL